MSEETKDEVICTAHSSVECSRLASFDRKCKLVLNNEEPYTSHCDFRLVIKAPVKPECEPKKPDSVTEAISQDHICVKTNDDLPF